MSTRTDIRAALAGAQAKRQCLRLQQRGDIAHMARMAEAGIVTRPYPSMYVERQYWDELNPIERTLHIMRTLAEHHPSMVFAGLSAASAWGFEQSFKLHADDGRITLAANTGTTRSGYCEQVRRLYMPQAEVDGAHSIGGIRVTSAARTLFDCGRLYEPRSALALFDSALRRNVLTKEDLVQYCDEPRRTRNQHQSLALAQLATGLSENGGESFCYATMAEEGVMLPEQQVEFPDSHNPNRIHRVDYLWRLGDGQPIAGEFDGQQKYVDPSMTNGQTVSGIVDQERSRQESLRLGGVTKIVRWFFMDAVARRPLVDKLAAAGVPIGPRRSLWRRSG